MRLCNKCELQINEFNYRKAELSLEEKHEVLRHAQAVSRPLYHIMGSVDKVTSLKILAHKVVKI